MKEGCDDRMTVLWHGSGDFVWAHDSNALVAKPRNETKYTPGSILPRNLFCLDSVLEAKKRQRTSIREFVHHVEVSRQCLALLPGVDQVFAMRNLF